MTDVYYCIFFSKIRLMSFSKCKDIQQLYVFFNKMESGQFSQYQFWRCYNGRRHFGNS